MLYKVEFKKKNMDRDWWWTAMNTHAERDMFDERLQKGPLKNLKKCAAMRVAKARAERWPSNEYRVVPM